MSEPHIEINSLRDALAPTPETRELVLNNETGFFTHNGEIAGGWIRSTYPDLNAPLDAEYLDD